MTETKRIIISGMRILRVDRWVKDEAVVVADGKIRSIIPVDDIKHHLPAKHIEFPANNHLVPGFIDMHIHGAKGSDVMDGSNEALQTISNALAAEGVTGYLATTMTADNERIEAALVKIPEAMGSAEGAAIWGVHLEGPFLSPEKSGAQNAKNLQLPDWPLFQRWQKMAANAIKVVTLAPELEGALPFIQGLSKAGVIASIGHTNATFKQTEEAIQAGCTQATHFFNSMRAIHQRDPGAICSLLLSDKINAELIVDNLHLHPAIVQLILRLKGKDHLILVTDAMRAKCLGDGKYDLGGQTVTVTGNKAELDNGKLAGSTLVMPQAITNMKSNTDCTLIEAINMATRNPARILGVSDKKGTIEVGKDADLAVMNKDFEVVMTFRDGRIIFQSK